MANSTPPNQRPWSIVDDEELRLLRQVADRARRWWLWQEGQASYDYLSEAVTELYIAYPKKW